MYQADHFLQNYKEFLEIQIPAKRSPPGFKNVGGNAVVSLFIVNFAVMNKVMNNKRDSGSDRRGIAFASGMILILSVTLCYMTAVVAYMVGGGISAWSLPAATLMAAAVAALSLDLRDVAWALPGALAVWALWIVACMNLYDSSFDGVLYHMEIVAQLYSGWNPVMDTMGIFSTEPWAQHYAKGMEMAGACVMCLTDDIQSSKAVMPVLATGLLLLLPAWTARLRPGLGVRKRWILAFLTISNPVLICQMLRFYIDDAVYICIVLAIMSSLSLLSCGKRDISDLLILGAAIILAAATKPNALFFVALALGCIIAGAYVARRREGLLDLTIFCAVTVILAVCIFSYHPYITNWLIKGHPLYPLMGEGAVDIMTGHTDEMFSGHNRFYNFFRSIYTVARPTVAQGYGGFTPFFMILLPCSAAIIAICCIRRRCLGADGYAALCIFALLHIPAVMVGTLCSAGLAACAAGSGNGLRIPAATALVAPSPEDYRRAGTRHRDILQRHNLPRSAEIHSASGLHL